MFTPLFAFLDRVLRAMKGEDERPFDIEVFNKEFVSGVRSIKDDLDSSIGLFTDILLVAGPFTRKVELVIRDLRHALEYENRATEDPWERGVASWNDNLHKRDDELRKAYSRIRSINQELQKELQKLKTEDLDYRRD